MSQSVAGFHRYLSGASQLVVVPINQKPLSLLEIEIVKIIAFSLIRPSLLLSNNSSSNYTSFRFFELSNANTTAAFDVLVFLFKYSVRSHCSLFFQLYTTPLRLPILLLLLFFCHKFVHSNRARGITWLFRCLLSCPTQWLLVVHLQIK